ncbi:FHA domain-containing protein [Chitinispirillales bacterium ANBcel5]|uniref:FHA domain-containing protein n=1 Tax=Cellulosispirillum alkaliphilum TaxID=3039283 RepID=UPI002A56307B|nr:FHA domain-containing protein [Chitinispirillales bacterium ANBcel5]
MNDTFDLDYDAESVYYFPLDGRERTIGKDPSCAMRLAGVGVSRKHALVRCDSSKPEIFDTGSKYGIYVDGRSFQKAILKNGSILSFGVLQFAITIENKQLAFTLLSPARTVTIEDKREISIGRSEQNEISLSHPLVSRVHARFRSGPDGYELIDNGSTNGTYVNGKAIRRAEVFEGDVIHIGPFRFYVQGGFLHSSDAKRGACIEASNVNVALKKRVFLRNVSISVEPGAFVSLLGSSGSGKSILSRVLTGEIVPQSGSVCINGLLAEKLANVSRRDIGYVSQSDLLRPELTVWETFVEQSVLRLSSDSTKAERVVRVKQIVELLELGALCERRVRELSGGERKRVHLGIELLASPGLVILDEPLDGLDPGLVRRFMKLFRRISDKGHTLLLITHSLEQIELCDRIIFLHEGKVLYNGQPESICSHFGVSSLAEVYEETSGPNSLPFPPSELLIDKETHRCLPLKEKISLFLLPLQNRFFIKRVLSQLVILLSRYLKVTVRNKLNLLLLFLQAPLMAFFLALVFRADAALFPANFYCALTISALWLGALNSVREIAREWWILRRERSAGMQPGSYILARLGSCFVLSLAQALLFASSLHILFGNLPVSFLLFFLLAVATFCGSTLGLTVSALSTTVGRALSIMPMVLIPQIVFSGILLPVDAMSGPGRWIGELTFFKPIYSMMLNSFVFEQNVGMAKEWTSLFYLTTGLIILMIVALTGRSSARTV